MRAKIRYKIISEIG